MNYCYICHEFGDSPLIQTCCTLVVHRECLLRWIEKTGNTSCAACQKKFPLDILLIVETKKKQLERRNRFLECLYICHSVGYSVGLCFAVLSIATKNYLQFCVGTGLVAVNGLVVGLICVIARNPRAIVRSENT